jgi:uncharacterized protein YpmB
MRNKKKLIGGAVLAVFALLLGLYIFADSIIAKEWDDKREAVRRAYKESMLVKADRVEPFVGAEPYIIVFGQDKLGKKMIVWVSETSIHSEYEADGITADGVTEKVKASAPDTKIMRITPGTLEEDYVWEVYYQRKQEDGKTGSFYEYYRFSDGTYLDTYRLGFNG